eukprot:786988-Prorocentrum_minimum.AAC.2
MSPWTSSTVARDLVSKLEIHERAFSLVASFPLPISFRTTTRSEAMSMVGLPASNSSSLALVCRAT